MKSLSDIYTNTGLMYIVGVVLFAIFSVLVFYLFSYSRRERDEDIQSRNPTVITNQFTREYWYWLSNPMFNFFIKNNISPNSITWLSVFAGFASGATYAMGNVTEAGWLLFLSGGLDTIDGRVARMQNNITVEGAFFDSVMDRYADFFIYAGIILRFTLMPMYPFGPETTPALMSNVFVYVTLLAILGSILISYSKERGANLGATDDRGLMQRADRVTVLGLMSVFDPVILLIQELVLQTEIYNYHFGLLAGLFLIAILSNFTAMRRIANIRRILREKK